MRLLVYPSLIAAVLITLATFGFAQNQRTIRWQESQPGSTLLLRTGGVSKELVVDGAKGVTITASISERFNRLCVDLEINNFTLKTIEIRPEDIQLQGSYPGFANPRLVRAEALAKEITDAARRRAAMAESSGSTATKTVHETVPVTETTYNPASAGDPTQPAVITTTKTETRVNTVPDDAARARASHEAAAIRGRAETDQRQILGTALRAAPLAGNTLVRGKIYYDYGRYLQDTILRIPLGDTIIEIPFKTYEVARQK